MVSTAADEEDSLMITKRDQDTLFNFGPASSRDEIVYTAERPGGDPSPPDARISSSVVQEWVEYVKGKMGIQQVMILLDDQELDDYEEPGLIALYQDSGLTVHRNPMGVPGSAKNAEKILKAAESTSEKIVAHCTHGMGRSGRVAAGWLAIKYGLSPEEATQEAIETARKHGMERMGNTAALESWLNA